MKVVLLCFAFLWITSCAENQVKPVHQVTCKYWLQKCHLKASHRCDRSAYTVISSVRTEKIGGPQGRYKEFIMRFTCR
ncbi:MAG: hypothetical protein KDD33_04900 [Bdellovibrionales bacterium]|nr:hypothetical protein [Bdellovibrionales bacterium]